MGRCKDFYSEIKDVAAQLRRVPFKYYNDVCSEETQEIWASSLCMQYCLVLDLLGDTPEARRIGRTFTSQISSYPIKVVGSLMKASLALIRGYSRIISDRDVFSYDDFKHHLDPYSDLAGAFFAPVKSRVMSFLVTCDPYAFRDLTQWICLLYKVHVQEDLGQSLLEDYLKEEDLFSSFTYNSTLMAEVNTVIREWFGDMSFRDTFNPHHGPGAIAGVKGRPSQVDKYSSFTIDQMYVASMQHIDVQWMDYFPVTPTVVSYDECRVCDVVFVPKTVITDRVISKENGALMFAQQGIKDCIVKHIEEHPYLRQIIDLSNQDRNRNLARDGSYDGSYSTIDLSSASDYVTVSLVKAAFRGTKLLEYLIAFRSRWARIDLTDQDGDPVDSVITRLEKYAPMGSALCFPVECIIFSALCEVATRRRYRKPKIRYCVYGDDIVCETPLFDDICLILEFCNFKVNHLKSYGGYLVHNFREACGGEYFDGFEVTPFHISRKYSPVQLTKMSANWAKCYIDMANECFCRLLLSCRAYLLLHLNNLDSELRKFSRTIGFPFVFASSQEEISGTDLVLLSWFPTNVGLKVGFSKTLQQRFVKCLTATTTPLDASYIVIEDGSAYFYTDQDIENIRYHLTLRVLSRRQAKSKYFQRVQQATPNLEYYLDLSEPIALSSVVGSSTALKLRSATL